jgi:elongation factor 1-gamma
MDEFKREYSNKDTLKEALPYFWKNFEKDNYSIWYCNYKYNSELKKIFMTCNLIGGKFCQSLHRARQSRRSGRNSRPISAEVALPRL